MALAPLREAVGSLAKASTPEPLGKPGGPGLWRHKGLQLPPYVQHIARDIMQQRGKSESQAIAIAIGIVKHPPANWGPEARAAAAKAAAEWEKLGSSKLHASYVPTFADERALRDCALERIAVLEAQFGLDGLPLLLAEGLLQEAAQWAPMLKRTASASSESERHEVHDGSGQHVGTIARRPGFRAEPDRFSAHAINGERITDYSGTSREKALEALRKHLEEAPARVGKHANGKWLVARPASYSGPDSYTAFPTQSSARFAAGLPEKPSVPEQGSQVAKLGEMLRMDLITVSGVDIPPLRRVQEARREDPFELIAEAFNAGELRDFHGRWRLGGHHALLSPASIRPGAPRMRARTAADIRYEGGVVRASARARTAHGAKRQIPLKEMARSIGAGKWTAGATRAVQDIRAGRVKDTEHAHRTGPSGKLGAYSAERTALHQEILRKLFQGKAEHPGRARAIFTAGGPASGKSTLVDSGLLGLPGDVVHVNPDVVREMLPEYKRLLESGRKDASQLMHEEASHVAKLAMAYALKFQHHVLVDTVGDSERGKYAGKIKDAVRSGHDVSVHYATLPVPLALKLAEKRRLKTGRAVGEKFLRQAHRDVSLRFAQEISKLTGVHIRVFDTSQQGKAKLVWEKRPHDTFRIVDRAGFARFLRKGGEY